MTILRSEYFNNGVDGAGLGAELDFDAIAGSLAYTNVSPIEGVLDVEGAGTSDAWLRWTGLTYTEIYIGIWMRMDALPTSLRCYVGDVRTTGGSRISNFRFETTGVMHVRDNISSVDDTGSAVVSNGNDVYLDWFVSAVTDTQTMRIYVNDVLVDTLTGTANTTAASATLDEIGILESGGGFDRRYAAVVLGDDWTYADVKGVGDTTDPVVSVTLTAKNASYDASDVLTACTFDVDADATDDVAVTDYLWDDNGAGGSFSSTTVASPTYTPPDLVSGPWTLTCTVSDAASNTNADSVVASVPTSGSTEVVVSATLIPSDEV